MFLFGPKTPEALFKKINLYPPMIGAGIKVLEVTDNFTRIKVVLRHRWWNKNVVGTAFGGSLYMMTDPFFMAIMMVNLGRDYIVWDKSAQIDFIKPGRGDVFATFHIAPEEIARVKALADQGEKVLPTYSVDIVDGAGVIVARVTKGLYVRKKEIKNT